MIAEHRKSCPCSADDYKFMPLKDRLPCNCDMMDQILAVLSEPIWKTRSETPTNR